MSHPSQLAACRAADDLTPAVTELLCYTMIAHNTTPRVATEDIVIGTLWYGPPARAS
ncbi:hypothetical protein [Streptomyces adustus]|uniref:hypothetical protein n=1 Tax=Streptomyces adustus TaxID=1609272 RepID=UPI0012E07EC5|nr:hypothetical protein [Streptomyces adustus]